MLPRVVLMLAALLAVAACVEQDEGEGSVSMRGVGLLVIPWWAIGAAVLAWEGVVWLRKRRRR